VQDSQNAEVVDIPGVKGTDPIASAVGRLAGKIYKEVIGTGGIAELRHALHQDIPGPTFWQLLTNDVIDAGVSVANSSIADWALIMGGMAQMSPNHSGNKAFGRALAECDYPESRLQTLLAADPGTQTFRDAIFGTIVWLDREAQSVDWRQIARLVILRDPDKILAHQRRIARDYYAVHKDEE
jgi:hypothetical protein